MVLRLTQIKMNVQMNLLYKISKQIEYNVLNTFFGKCNVCNLSAHIITGIKFYIYIYTK